MMARSLGNVHYLSNEKTQELLDLKKKWGFDDPRNTSEYENCDVCANDIFRDSWGCRRCGAACVFATCECAEYSADSNFHNAGTD